MTFADWLCGEMDRTGISIAGLGKAIGASESTVFGWRIGRREPVTETRQRLAIFFGVPVEDLTAMMQPPGRGTKMATATVGPGGQG